MHMRFYSFYPNGEDALVLVPADLNYFQDHFVGKHMAATWVSPVFTVSSKSRPVRDFISWFSAAMVVSERAKESLEPLIGRNVEFLPFATIKGSKFFAVNVIEVIDCLDHKASGVTHSPDDATRIIHVERFVFDNARLRNVPLFKVPEWPGEIFVSEEFAKIVEDKKLAGAGFDNPEDIRWVKEPWDGTFDGLPKVHNFSL